MTSLSFIETYLSNSKDEVKALRNELESLSSPLLDFFETWEDSDKPREFPEEINPVVKRWFNLGDTIESFIIETYSELLNNSSKAP